MLVITGWDNGRDFSDAARVFRYAINGRSWPHTERLAYAVGDRRTATAAAAVGA